MHHHQPSLDTASQAVSGFSAALGPGFPTLGRCSKGAWPGQRCEDCSQWMVLWLIQWFMTAVNDISHWPWEQNWPETKVEILGTNTFDAVWIQTRASHSLSLGQSTNQPINQIQSFAIGWRLEARQRIIASDCSDLSSSTPSKNMKQTTHLNSLILGC